MLDIILGRKAGLCNGVSRRDFLRIGSVGALGVTLPGMLASEARAAKAVKSSDEARKSRPNRAKSVILLYLGGGLSHHDSFDPKPEAPEEVRGKYTTIDTVVPGLRITEMLPR